MIKSRWYCQSRVPTDACSGCDAAPGVDCEKTPNDCTVAGCLNPRAKDSRFCRDCGAIRSEQPADVLHAPTLEEVRAARRGLAREVDKRKADLATWLGDLFPGARISIRAVIEPRADLGHAEAQELDDKLRATGVTSEQCQCAAWEAWGHAIVGSHGSHRVPYPAGDALRERVTTILENAESSRRDGTATARLALEVSKTAQAETDRARRAEKTAHGRRTQADNLLRRCFCGRPEVDATYPTDRDKYLGR